MEVCQEVSGVNIWDAVIKEKSNRTEVYYRAQINAIN